MIQKIRHAGIPIYTGIKSIEALGNSKFEKIRFKNGTKYEELSAGLLLLHNGVVPNVQITRQLGCEHRWYDLQRYWEPVVDDWGNTSLDGVSIAGDCGRISGSSISEFTTIHKYFTTQFIAKNKVTQMQTNQLKIHFIFRFDNYLYVFWMEKIYLV